MSSRRRYTTRYPGIRYRLLDDDRPDGPRRYIIGYTGADGRYHTETLGVGYTLEDAKARKAALEGKRVVVDNKRTVGLLLDEYIEARKDTLTKKTYENYRSGAEAIKKEIGHRRLKDLTPNDCAALIAALKGRGLKTWSVKKILTPLVGALKVAVREGWIQSSPLEALLPHERPKADQREMRCLASEEIPRLLAAASSARWQTLFAFLLFTGLRIGEATVLTWDDIDFDNGRVYVRAEQEGARKTAAARREVMLIPDLANRLRRHRLAQAPGTTLVFTTQEGDRVTPRTALKALHRAEKRAGLPRYTLHELRHTFASILIGQGEQVTLVSDQMGHADPSVTLKTYAHLFDAQKNIEAARGRLQEAVGTMV